MIFGGFVSAFSQHFYFEPNIYETCIVFRITTLIKRKHQDRQSLKLHAIRAAVTQTIVTFQEDKFEGNVVTLS